MIVTNATIFNGNPYHQLMYCMIEDRFRAVKGNFDDALTALKEKRSRLLHVHWEENPLRKCLCEGEADSILIALKNGLNRYKDSGGKIAWTIHNRLPHQLEYTRHFLQLRKALGETADLIHVHNTEAITTLSNQIEFPISKVFWLPHPSYATINDPLPADSAPERDRKTVLFFGLIRNYKGLDFLMDAAAATDMSPADFTIKIRGDVLPDDPYGDRVEAYGVRQNVDLEIGRVHNRDVAPLLQSVQAVVLPYERFLTSGVALLAMTTGTPIVAPDEPQMRELLPPENHDFLFKPGNKKALRDAIQKITSLTQEETKTLSQANLARADEFHPHKISIRLGHIYEELSG